MSKFNDAWKRNSSGIKDSIFMPGITTRRLCKKDSTTTIRILPAFDPENPDPSTSWIPSLNPDGEPQDFAWMIYTAEFLGYGPNSNRISVVSPRTFNEDDADPLEDLYSKICADKDVWGYMLGTKDSIDKPFSRAGMKVVLNVIDVANVTQDNGPILGILSNSAAQSLMKLITTRNTSMPEHLVAENYLLGFAHGDVTDPNEGRVLTVSPDASKKRGTFAEYAVSPLITRDPRTRKESARSYPLTTDLLAQRLVLTQPETYIQKSSYEEIVRKLVGIYNRRSPEGHHEYDLLREAFPEYSIPPAPSAPGGLSSVQAGWSSADAGAPAVTIPSATPPRGGFSVPSRPAAPRFAVPPSVTADDVTTADLTAGGETASAEPATQPVSEQAALREMATSVPPRGAAFPSPGALRSAVPGLQPGGGILSRVAGASKIPGPGNRLSQAITAGAGELSPEQE